MTIVTLGLLWAVAISAFSAVFSDGSWIAPTVATVVLALLIERGVTFARGRGVNGVLARLVANLAHLIGLFIVIGLALYPETMLVFLPTPATVSAWIGGIVRAGDLVDQSVPPLPAAPFLGLVIPAVWWCAAASAAGMWTSGASALAVAPPVTLFIAAGFISRGRVGLVWFGLLFIAAALAVIAADVERMRASPKTFVAPAAFAVVVLLAGALLAPALPGFGQPALFDPRNQVGTTIPDNPLVDIRPRVVDLADTVVFKVSGVPRSYWRLTSLATFDGQRWSTTGPDAPELPMPDVGVRLQPEVLIENLDSRWLPVPSYPRNPPEGSTIDRVTNAVEVDGRTRDNTRYFAESLATNPSSAQLEAVRIPAAGDLRYYLQLPPESPRVKQWTRETTAGARSPYEAALKIQDRLRSTFTYDTRVAPGHTNADLERFLFETQRGYCEQFASAMAVTARLAGIPSRVAIGYLSESSNRETDAKGGDVWVVKGNDAHAWPELFFPGYGWLAFEPTPSRSVPQAGYLGSASDDAAPQTTAPPATAAPTTVPSSSAPAPTTTPGGSGAAPPPATPSWVQPFATLCAVVLLVVLVVGAVPGAKLVRRRRRHDDGAEGAWREALDLLADAGVVVPPSATPHETAARAAAIDLDLSELAGLVTLVRYTPPEDAVASGGANDAFGPGTAAAVAWRCLDEAERDWAGRDRRRNLARRWSLASLVPTSRSTGAGSSAAAGPPRDPAAHAAQTSRGTRIRRSPVRTSR